MLSRTILTIFIICFILPAASARAQEPGNTNVKVNVLYAFELGFGSYDIGGLDVDVYKLPLSYTFGLSSDGRLRLRIASPISYGRFRFEGKITDGTKITAEQDVMAYVPGVELQYEVLKNWYLKPFTNFGLTWSLDEKIRPKSLNADVDDSLNFIYGIGIKSLYRIFWQRFRFSLGNSIQWAINSQFDGDQKESFGVLENGVEALHPMGFTVKGFEPDASVFFIYYRFLPDAKFSRFLDNPRVVRNQYEVSGSIGSAKPIKIAIFKNPRIGAGYRFGDLNAFTINFGFPF